MSAQAFVITLVLGSSVFIVVISWLFFYHKKARSQDSVQNYLGEIFRQAPHCTKEEMKAMIDIVRLKYAVHQNKEKYERFMDAVETITERIKSDVLSVPEVADRLPRGYRVVIRKCGGKRRCGDPECDSAEQYYLVDINGEYIDGIGSFMCDESKVYIREPNLAATIKFVENVSDGLLEEIRVLVEKKNAEIERYMATLNPYIKPSDLPPHVVPDEIF